VLVDGMVMESFWDGGRARTTLQANGVGLPSVSTGLPGITVDASVWRMGTGWLS